MIHFIVVDVVVDVVFRSCCWWWVNHVACPTFRITIVIGRSYGWIGPIRTGLPNFHFNLFLRWLTTTLVGRSSTMGGSWLFVFLGWPVRSRWWWWRWFDNQRSRWGWLTGPKIDLHLQRGCDTTTTDRRNMWDGGWWWWFPYWRGCRSWKRPRRHTIW